jgi:hypothetical protein
VTFCPPALAIQDMSPDAPTSPPGGASGLKFFGGPAKIVTPLEPTGQRVH